MSASTDNNEVPTNDKAPASSNQSQSRKGKKRKRVKQSDKDEQYQKERTDRYNKLHHACTKHFHREAKVVKSFECQKIVRSIKALKDTLSNGDGDGEATTATSKQKKRLETLQQKLDRTKKMELDILVQIGLKRLGVLSLDPKLVANDTNDSISDDNRHTKATSQSEDPFYQALLESMFRHKRLSNALDQLNEKVTDYRQWTVRRAQGGNNNNYGDDQLGGKKGKKKKKKQSSDPGNETLVVAGGFNSRKRGLNLGGHEGASGLFIGSLSGMAAEGYDDEEEGGDEYGDDYEYPTVEKKKNRPGQRARRAKAMAIEAKNAGKTWDSSINWREKKDDTDGDQIRSTGVSRGGERRDISNSRERQNTRNKSNTDNKPKEAKHQDIATMGKAWKEEGNAHPSWAAKAAAQKSQGIAEFKGKKITFD